MAQTKQLSYAGKGQPAARVGNIHALQVAEIAALTGESQNEVVRSAITRYYMDVVYQAQERKIAELQEALLKCEAALVDAVNRE